MTYAKAQPIDKETFMSEFGCKFMLTERRFTVGPLLKQDIGIAEFYDVYLIRLPAGNLQGWEKSYFSNSFEYIKKIINKSLPQDSLIYPGRDAGLASLFSAGLKTMRFLSIPKIFPDKNNYSILEFIISDAKIRFPELKYGTSYEYGKINGGLRSYGLEGYKSGPRVFSSGQ